MWCVCVVYSVGEDLGSGCVVYGEDLGLDWLELVRSEKWEVRR